MQITINRAALKAVLRFASKEGVRYYMNGVLVEANATETRLVATDGHTLGAHRSEVENSGECTMIIPRESVEAALKLKISKSFDIMVLEQVGDSYTLGIGDQKVIFKPIDGKFPDYSRVAPSELSGVVAQFNGEYVKRCHDARADFHPKKGSAEIAHNGNGAALVDIGVEGFFAVLMPFKGGAPSASLCDWARKPIAVKPELKAVA